MNGILYVVATPIGNTEDMTGRAKRILSEVDIVASEDTRVTQKLFNILGIHNKTVSNHKFNEKLKADSLILALTEGKNVAIVSDAGTPCISDPGGVIVKAAAAHGIKIESIPGASSVITALSVCGMTFDSFAFSGFLPKEGKEIKKKIEAARKSGISVFVFFESPKRIKKTLTILAAETPEAELCLCNDLTKMFERIYRGKPEEILTELSVNPAAEKGEYTLILEFGLNESQKMGLLTDSVSQSPESMLVDYIIKNDSSLKEAVGALAKTHKGTITKRDFYDASLNLKALFGKGEDCGQGPQ
ncbi:MAG: 16S rRNA (cytidine(1402)-2'-O)-methyltransferase [Lachnospiraceae bacterium]|nr:16S rRNA (cytidine(1402)-2'-O)-methyltransferase [Lachnospiraceae bacterium]